MKRFLSIFLVACTSLTAMATGYERLSARMNDHFNHAEWVEVLQVTESMIKLKPLEVDPYAAALVAAQFLNDIATENRYLNQSQYCRIHIDSLLQHVYMRTKLIHNAQVYENLLLNLKANHKGLARVFNIYLLDFYAFARKTNETITIADELLKHTPDNLRFRKIKADALFYQGDAEEAVDIYESIIRCDSTNYEVVTLLAAYYTAQVDKHIEQLNTEYTSALTPNDALYAQQLQAIIDTHAATALLWLSRTENIRPSDFIKNEILRMQNITRQPPLHPSLAL